MLQKIKNIYHLCIAIFANVWFFFPSRKLTIIGVTGTDGKTTTVSLIYHILSESGYDVSMVSTVGAIIGGENYDVGFHVTNPEPFSLQRFIKKASEKGRYLILEVTSHGLDQNRVYGIHFDIGVITNVTHEHLDYHKTYDRYLQTKLKLLFLANAAVINKDDASYQKIAHSIKEYPQKKWITYGITSSADITPSNFQFSSALIGEFNRYNILAAATVCKQLGLKDQAIRRGILTFTPPIGRQEIVYAKDFKVIVDFAHTPNAFEKILSSLRKSAKGRLIHVFGSAGQRDKTKRPLMGKISSQFSDIIIITAEDPRKEHIEDITLDITKGITDSSFEAVKTIEQINLKSNKKYIMEVSDRMQAIAYAIQIAKKGDIVIITGKSHEKSMNYGHGEEPWNEFTAVNNALAKRKAHE